MLTNREQSTKNRSISLTPEGWVYLVILAFVSFGSILRNVNLLVVLSGMMFAAFLLNWRLAVQCLKTIDADRTFPKRIFAQNVTRVVWRCSNRHLSHPAFSVNIEDRIDIDDPNLEALVEKKTVGFFARLRQRMADSVNRLRRVGTHQVRVNYRMVPAAADQSLVYQMWFQRRGQFIAGTGEIYSTFPFGLIEVRVGLDQSKPVFVSPAIGTLRPGWHTHANAALTGTDSSSRKRGSSDDQFFALRKWQSGDGRKQIHWRSTAKIGVPMVKQFDQPSDRDSAVVIDLFQDDLVPAAAIETLLSFAATAGVELSAKTLGKVAFSICGQQTHFFRHLGQREACSKLLRQLAVATSTDDPELIRGIEQVGGSVAAGTPILVISTRDTPQWLRQFTTDRSPIGALPAGVTQSNDLFQALVTPDIALGRLTEQISWLQVDSDLFGELFSPAQERDEVNFAKFRQRWNS